VVLEGAPALLVVDDPAHRRDVALLHRQDHVVLERLGVPLDQEVVGRQAGAADAEAGDPDEVLECVGQRAQALGLGDRREVLGEGLLDPAALGVLQAADPGAAAEAPLVVVDHGRRVQQGDPGGQLGGLERVLDQAGGVVQPERPGVVVVAVHELVHLVEVGAQAGLDPSGDLLVGQRLGPAHHGDAGDQPLQVPGEVPQVGLVEVVHVEDQVALAVHVRAEVLDVQVALDPDPAGALVRPRVLALRGVGVEQRGAAAVEGRRLGRHLAELAAHRRRVGLGQLPEGLGEHVDDQVRAVARGLGHGGHPATVGPGTRAAQGAESGRTSGNRIVSRIGAPVSSMTSRSMPIPWPPIGGAPCSSARRKSSSSCMASGSPPAALTLCS
jgi:hypothetical protein